MGLVRGSERDHPLSSWNIQTRLPSWTRPVVETCLIQPARLALRTEARLACSICLTGVGAPALSSEWVTAQEFLDARAGVGGLSGGGIDPGAITGLGFGVNP